MGTTGLYLPDRVNYRALWKQIIACLSTRCFGYSSLEYPGVACGRRGNAEHAQQTDKQQFYQLTVRDDVDLGEILQK